jgi:methyl-accepting chemotaxis protein-4 (peptide sensor receptor)
MQTRAWLLQASTSLNKAGTLTALSYPPDDIKALMKQAKDNLKDADNSINEFLNIPALTDEGKRCRTERKPLIAWHGDLEHQAAWLESNQLSDFMSAPVQQSQDAFDQNFTAWQQHINHFVETAKAEGKATISARR